MTIARRLPRWPAALIGILALVVAIGAAADDAPPPADPPAGELLIASAEIRDPRFVHAVVLLVRHDDQGAFGIIINHPLGERPLADILSDAEAKPRRDDKESAAIGGIQVFFGGPVQLQLGFVIHSAEYRQPQTLIVSDDLAMTSTPGVLRDIAHHQGPAKYLLAFGYAGWGAGQLEGEIARNGWFTAPADADLVFDAERATLWEKALARRSREL